MKSVMKVLNLTLFLLFIQVNFIVQAQENSVVVKVMNYEDLGRVELYDKFEIGVHPGQAVQNSINRFVLKQSGEKINPFLEWEIRVFAEFINRENDTTITVDGFYFEAFTGEMRHPLPKPTNRIGYSDVEYKSLGRYNKVNDSYPFRIRFAPPFTGKWEFKVHVITTKKNMLSSAESFTVIPSSNSGYISVSENNRFLSKKGKSFIPVGCNMPWPQTRIEFDEEFAELNRVGEKRVVLEEQYRPNKVLPRVHKVYRDLMKEMASNGANYMRMIMYPSATDIEWEELGNYTDRLPIALEMDSILMTAEEEQMYIQWNLQIHYCFQLSEFAYWTRWTWDGNVNGNRFCYATIPDVNGVIDFFNNEEAKKYYKQRLRYILARWGYSTNISMFELFSEISNVGTREADASGFYQEGENWKLSRDWQWEMAAYIKSQHNGKAHLLTGSYAGPIHPDDDIFSSPNLDIMASNIYDYGDPSFSYGYWNKNVAGKYLNESCYEPSSYTTSCKDKSLTPTIKPLVFSEAGPVFVEGACREDYVETNRFFWQSLFSGLAGALSWDAWYFKENYSSFKPLAKFIDQFDLGKEGWHPGASKVKNMDDVDLWQYNHKYSISMDHLFAPKGIFSWKKRDRKADISYLRKGNKEVAIGVITNKTYNIGNINNCFKWTEFEGTVIEHQEDVDTKKERLKLRGMKGGKYRIEYYLPNDLENPIAVSEDRGPKVKIEHLVKANEKEFIVIFVAKRK